MSNLTKKEKKVGKHAVTMSAFVFFLTNLKCKDWIAVMVIHKLPSRRKS